MRRLRLTRPRAWALFTAGKSLDFISTHSLTWFSPDNAPPGLCPNGLWASCRPRDEGLKSCLPATMFLTSVPDSTSSLVPNRKPQASLKHGVKPSIQLWGLRKGALSVLAGLWAQMVFSQPQSDSLSSQSLNKHWTASWTRPAKNPHEISSSGGGSVTATTTQGNCY